MLKILVSVLIIINFVSQAESAVDVKNCEEQLRDVVRVDIACAIEIQPDSEQKDELIERTSGIVSDFICMLPISFRKEAIYSKYIKQDSVELPKLVTTCSIFGPGSEPLEVSATFQPKCVKGRNIWSCKPNASDIEGLGVLGRPLENYINQSEELKKQMGAALSGLRQ